MCKDYRSKADALKHRKDVLISQKNKMDSQAKKLQIKMKSMVATVKSEAIREMATLRHKREQWWSDICDLDGLFAILFLGLIVSSSSLICSCIMHICVFFLLIAKLYYFEYPNTYIKNNIQQEMSINVVLKVNENSCKKMSSVMLLSDRYMNNLFECPFMVVKTNTNYKIKNCKDQRFSLKVRNCIMN